MKATMSLFNAVFKERLVIEWNCLCVVSTSGETGGTGSLFPEESKFSDRSAAALCKAKPI